MCRQILVALKRNDEYALNIKCAPRVEDKQTTRGDGLRH